MLTERRLLSSNYSYLSFSFGLCLIVSLAFRGNELGTDTSRYIDFFSNLDLHSSVIFFEHRFGFSFISVMYIFKLIFNNVHVFFTFVILSLYYSTFRLFKSFLTPSTTSLFLVFICFYPFYLNYSVNTIRAGLALSFALLFLSNFLVNKKITVTNILFLIVSISIHKATLLFFIPILFYNLRTRNLLVLWVVAFTFSFMSGLLSPLLKVVFGSLPYFKDYYLYFNSEFVDNVNYGGEAVFYLKLIGTVPVLLFLILNYMLKVEFKKGVIQLFNYFIILNSLYLIFSFIPFSDRIGSYSWVLMPGILFSFYDSVNLGRHKASLNTFALFLVFIFILISEYYYGYYKGILFI